MLNKAIIVAVSAGALALIGAAPAQAQTGAVVTQCSAFFNDPSVTGTIVTSPNGVFHYGCSVRPAVTGDIETFNCARLAPGVLKGNFTLTPSGVFHNNCQFI